MDREQLLLIKGVCRHIGIMAELRQQSKRYERRSSSLHKMVYPSDMPLFTTSSHLEKQPLLDSPVIGTSYLAVMHEEVSSLNNHGQRGGAAGDDLDSSRHNGSMMVVSNDWDKLTLTEKLAVFNIWSVVSTLGNLLAMVYTSGGLVHHTEVITNSTLRLAIGLSCLMYWFSLVQYLEFNPRSVTDTSEALPVCEGVGNDLYAEGVGRSTVGSGCVPLAGSVAHHRLSPLAHALSGTT